MSVLKNTRHEAFAQALAKGKTADDAYQIAGFTANRGNATRLKANESIRNRVREIADRVSEKAEWTAADRLAALKRISEATEGADPRVAVSAISEANKMQGSHAAEKHELTGKDGEPITLKHTSAVTDMSEEEREMFRAMVLARKGRGEGDQT